MGFVKLDENMLNSTTWADRPARDVFITALLKARPRTISEETPQLEVGSLQETGWRVPAGGYGFVESSGVGLINCSMVPPDEGMPALERLGRPDPGSRSQEYEGRRLVRVNGGYLVLNYMKYRDKDHSAAARQSRWREREKDRKKKPVRLGFDPPDKIGKLPRTRREHAEFERAAISLGMDQRDGVGETFEQARPAEEL